ncbi:MAG: SIMPL domain-containing protein [Pseudomonadota bacterium]
MSSPSKSFFALAMLIVWIFAGPAVAQGSGERTILVSGEGVVTASPDIATVRLGVTTQDANAGTALSENSAQMEAVMENLTESGIELRDIQTSDFSVQPVYDRNANGNRSEIVGYSVRNILSVRVRDLDGLGALLDAVVGDGSNTLQGLTFGLSDPDAKQKLAEAAAVTDALSRARGMAEAAGLSLGPVLHIEAVGSAIPRPQAEMAIRAADSGAVPIARGELAIRAQVRVTVSLAE